MDVKKIPTTKLLESFIQGVRYWQDVEKARQHAAAREARGTPGPDWGLWFTDPVRGMVDVKMPTAESEARWAAIVTEIDRRIPPPDETT